MKKTLNRTVSAVLALVLLFTLLPTLLPSAKAAAGYLPEEGDKVVIYNAQAGAVFGAQPEDGSATFLTPVLATLTNSGIAVENGGLIFTVHTDDSYYTFENQGKYLRTSPNSSGGGNDEDLYFDASQSDYTKWRLEQQGDGYILYNKKATYSNKPVCIEFYSGAFSGWTYNGSDELFVMNFYKVEDAHNLGFVLNPKVKIYASAAQAGADYTFSFALEELTEVVSLQVEYATDNGAYTAIAPQETKSYTYSATIPAAALAGKQSLKLRVTAENEYDIRYDGSLTVTVSDDPFIAEVTPLPESAMQNEQRPLIRAVLGNCGSNPTITMQLDGATVIPILTGSSVAYQPTANLSNGRHTVELTVTRADGRTAEKQWSFYLGVSGIELYYGQMHSHTAEYSDGSGTLEDAYEHAMQANDVDFLFVTDHSNYFDTTSTATTTSYYNLSSLAKSGSKTKWEEARATAASYNAQSNDFVAAYAYEMTWSGGPGHTNTFNTYGVVSRNNTTLNNKNGYRGMYLYNDLMVNADNGLDVNGNPVAQGVKTKYIADAPVVSQFNHPGTTFGTFDEFGGYTPERDTVLCLIEVGNGSGAVGGSAYWPSYSEYDKCLSKGWHVAPTNNQDNHNGRWGDSNTCRDVVLTDDFTEAGLYRAMAARRVYATEDQNLRIYYYLNDQLMGSVVEDGGSEPDKVNIYISVTDPDGEALKKIEVIGENGATLKSFNTSGPTFQTTQSIANTDAYYYIKVTQADGDIAVTAPVWAAWEQTVHTHSYTTAVTAPTCTQQGYTTHTCTCGDSYRDTYTNALGHNLVTDPAVAATCTTTGLTAGNHCTRCDYRVAQTTVAALGHSWNAGVVTLAPTQTQTGIKTFTCTRCNATKTETIPMLNHVHSYTTIITAPTCTQQGYTTHTCTCGDSYRDTYTNALGHAWDAGTVTLAPTQTQTGIKTFICTRCSATKTETIPMLTHVHSYTAVVTPPTCTLKGYTTNTCACGESYKNCYTDALGHDRVTDTAIAATCTKNGLSEGSHCARCNAVLTAQQTVAALGHQFVNGVCTVCGAKDVRVEDFTDVKTDAWYYSAVTYAVQKGLFNGISATTFAPDTPMNRAMLVTVLWRYEGEPTPTEAVSFTDVPAKQWYTDSVAWAAKLGIVKGVGEGKFDPTGKITREQLATILFRYCEGKALPTNQRDDLSSFADAAEVSNYATQAMQWAVANGYISGMQIHGETRLDPRGNATRAQVATILMRLLKEIA